MAIVNDRIPTQPNRKKITNESTGAVEYATVEYADNPTVVGTPINKALFDQVQFWDIQEEEIPKYQKFFMKYCPSEDGFSSMFGTSQGTLIGVRYNIVYRSVDMGVSWTAITLPGGVTSSASWYRNGFSEHEGLIVGVGTSGNVIYSNDDGITWNRFYAGSSRTLTSICYYNGTWIAGAASGYISISTDLENWSSQKIDSAGDDLYAFASPSSGVIAVSEYQHAIYHSVDLSEWSDISSPIFSSDQTPQISWVADKWVMVGRSETQGYSAISTDGLNWEKNFYTSSGISVQNAFFYFDGDILLAVFKSGQTNKVYTSLDGVAWEEIPCDTILGICQFLDSKSLVASVNGIVFCMKGFGKVLFYSKEIQENNLLVKTNNEEVIGGECVMATGSYIGTGWETAVSIFTGFTPKAVFIANADNVFTAIYPCVEWSSSSSTSIYTWGDNGFESKAEGINTLGEVYCYVAIG